MKQRDKLRGKPTGFELVSDFNKAVGNRKATDLTDQVIEMQLGLITEEYSELIEAVAEGYMPNVRKELADLLVVCYGLGYLLNVNCDDDVAAVNTNNMTKLVSDAVAKRMTHKMYHDAGIDIDFVDVSPGTCVVISAKDQNVDGKFYKKGKRLKPFGYESLELS
jgi:predicted HAD superfamily Cof-like phosphohydrolase